MNGAWLKKSCFEVLWLKERPKYTQNEVFPALWKVNGEIVAYKLKIDLNNFFGKILFSGFRAKRVLKWAQKSILFQVIFQIKSQCMELFWVFCMTLHHHNNLELIEICFFFENKFVFEVLGPKVAHNGPNMRFFWYYQNSMHGTFLIFCMKLQQNKL